MQFTDQQLTDIADTIGGTVEFHRRRIHLNCDIQHRVKTTGQIITIRGLFWFGFLDGEDGYVVANVRGKLNRQRVEKHFDEAIKTVARYRSAHRDGEDSTSDTPK